MVHVVEVRAGMAKTTFRTINLCLAQSNQTILAQPYPGSGDKAEMRGVVEVRIRARGLETHRQNVPIPERMECEEEEARQPQDKCNH